MLVGKSECITLGIDGGSDGSHSSVPTQTEDDRLSMERTRVTYCRTTQGFLHLRTEEAYARVSDLDMACLPVAMPGHLMVDQDVEFYTYKVG